MRGIQPQSIEVKILEKTLSEFKKKKDKKKKEKKGGKTPSRILRTATKEPILGFKGI